MAAQAWKPYDEFKRYVMSGTIDLPTTAAFMHLVQSASNFATQSLSTLASLTSEVASGNGYTLSGKALTDTWSTGASTGEMRYDATAVIWTATGGTIPNIKAAVIVFQTGASAKDGANKLGWYASLTSSQFTLGSGNTLTITPSANGIFELN